MFQELYIYPTFQNSIPDVYHLADVVENVNGRLLGIKNRGKTDSYEGIITQYHNSYRLLSSQCDPKTKVNIYVSDYRKHLYNIVNRLRKVNENYVFTNNVILKTIEKDDVEVPIELTGFIPETSEWNSLRRQSTCAKIENCGTTIQGYLQKKGRSSTDILLNGFYKKNVFQTTGLKHKRIGIDFK